MKRWNMSGSSRSRVQREPSKVMAKTRADAPFVVVERRVGVVRVAAAEHQHHLARDVPGVVGHRPAEDQEGVPQPLDRRRPRHLEARGLEEGRVRQRRPPRPGQHVQLLHGLVAHRWLLALAAVSSAARTSIPSTQAMPAIGARVTRPLGGSTSGRPSVAQRASARAGEVSVPSQRGRGALVVVVLPAPHTDEVGLTGVVHALEPLVPPQAAPPGLGHLSSVDLPARATRPGSTRGVDRREARSAEQDEERGADAAGDEGDDEDDGDDLGVHGCCSQLSLPRRWWTRRCACTRSAYGGADVGASPHGPALRGDGLVNPAGGTAVRCSSTATFCRWCPTTA